MYAILTRTIKLYLLFLLGEKKEFLEFLEYWEVESDLEVKIKKCHFKDTIVLNIIGGNEEVCIFWI